MSTILLFVSFIVAVLLALLAVTHWLERPRLPSHPPLAHGRRREAR